MARGSQLREVICASDCDMTNRLDTDVFFQAES